MQIPSTDVTHADAGYICFLLKKYTYEFGITTRTTNTPHRIRTLFLLYVMTCILYGLQHVVSCLSRVPLKPPNIFMPTANSIFFRHRNKKKTTVMISIRSTLILVYTFLGNGKYVRLIYLLMVLQELFRLEI